MNLYLLEIISKILRMIFVAIISIFNLNIYIEKDNNLENSITNMNTYAYNQVILTEPTVKVSNNVKQPVKNNTVNKNVQNTSNNNQAVITNNSNGTTYVGRLTGYGPDCVGCSKVGNVACLTRNKTKHSLIKDGIYYEDNQYGKVRILAAATTKFKCGTIIEVRKPGMQPFIGIVLDTGGSMRKAWNNGNVWMDLAYSSDAMSGSDNLTGKNITFNVQRWGW